MRTARRIAFLLLAWLSFGPAQAQDEVRVLEKQAFSANQLRVPSSGSHRLALAVIQLEGSGWTRERALDALRETGQILAQCDVGIDRIEWIRLSTPARHLDFFTPLSRELARLYPTARPAIYLVRDTRNRPAFEAEAIGRGNSRTRPELADTVWMTAGVRDAGIALAHELAHVLMNSGEHSEEPGNLLRQETAAAGTRLSPAQCTLLQEQGLAHGLFAR